VQVRVYPEHCLEEQRIVPGRCFIHLHHGVIHPADVLLLGKPIDSSDGFLLSGLTLQELYTCLDQAVV
jgi:hypothetical protein